MYFRNLLILKFFNTIKNIDIIKPNEAALLFERYNPNIEKGTNTK